MGVGLRKCDRRMSVKRNGRSNVCMEEEYRSYSLTSVLTMYQVDIIAYSLVLYLQFCSTLNQMSSFSSSIVCCTNGRLTLCNFVSLLIINRPFGGYI